MRGKPHHLLLVSSMAPLLSAAEQWRDDVTDPIPHYVADIQDMLRARIRAHPVEPVRKNLVPREKTAGRRVNGVIIGSKRNNVKNASRKRLQQLIDKQTDRDGQSILRGQVNNIVSRKLPGKYPYISFHVPTPKGVIPIPLDEKNTIRNKLPYLTPNLLSQVTPLPSSRHAYAPVITQDEDKMPIKDNQQFVSRRS